MIDFNSTNQRLVKQYLATKEIADKLAENEKEISKLSAKVHAAIDGTSSDIIHFGSDFTRLMKLKAAQRKLSAQYASESTALAKVYKQLGIVLPVYQFKAKKIKRQRAKYPNLKDNIINTFKSNPTQQYRAKDVSKILAKKMPALPDNQTIMSLLAALANSGFLVRVNRGQYMHKN